MEVPAAVEYVREEIEETRENNIGKIEENESVAGSQVATGHGW